MDQTDPSAKEPQSVDAYFVRYSSGYKLEQLLAVQKLVSVLEEGRGDGSQKAFLGGYAKALIPAMLMNQSVEDVRMLAALMGAQRTGATPQMCIRLKYLQTRNGALSV